MPSTLDPLAGLTVLERGWLSSNNILIHAAAGEAGAVLVDSSHVNHAQQTVALVRHALAGGRLDRIVNTHLHSDHCGGNATLQRAFGVPVMVPPGHADAVREWDESSLTYEASGQRCERFEIAGTHAPGDEFTAGGRHWQVLAAPGHDPHSVLLFDAEHGVLISADALWERGFGVVFPEIEGEPGFDDVGAVLDVIERLPVRVVIPGHGAPFTDVAAALANARSRLASFQADPARHARHALKVLIKYHVMEEQRQPLDDLLRWAVATPMLAQLWARHGVHESESPAAWAERFVHELVAGGVLARQEGIVSDR
jgi:glyoxylase-like metal-dependent hydrolase (beta-lactamase superfamily II)